MLGQRKIQVEDKDYVQTMGIIGQDVNGFKKNLHSQGLYIRIKM